jgi:ubiquinone/menaquinone biosynthesis C-methylase UbiE
MKRPTHKFDPKWAEMLEQRDSDLTFSPIQALKDLGLKETMKVADLGAGPGYFTEKIAKIVGPKGIVYAVDIQEEMLEKLKVNMERLGIKNYQPILSKENLIPMNDGALDFCFMSSVLHELYDPPKFLCEIRRILNKGGLLGVIDWKKESSDQGPPIEERISVEEAKGLIENSGGKVKRSWDNGAHQYLLKAEY